MGFGTWVQKEWAEVRGNAKYDAYKYVFFVLVLGLGAAVWQFIGRSLGGLAYAQKWSLGWAFGLLLLVTLGFMLLAILSGRRNRRLATRVQELETKAAEIVMILEPPKPEPALPSAPVLVALEPGTLVAREVNGGYEQFFAKPLGTQFDLVITAPFEYSSESYGKAQRIVSVQAKIRIISPARDVLTLAHGCWVGSELNHIDFSIGDVRNLVIIQWGKTPVVFDDPREDVTDKKRIVPMPLNEFGQYDVAVSLILKNNSTGDFLAEQKFAYSLWIEERENADPGLMLELVTPA
jgi:hypothetical protein